jgi:SAM-dependent methyltransferase
MQPTLTPTFSGGAALSCKVCGASLDGCRKHLVREMYFGTREKFSYLECPACGSLQIEAIPPDLSRFYPGNYGPQGMPLIGPQTKVEKIKSWLRGHLTLHQLGRRSVLGRLISFIRPHPTPLPVWLAGRHVDLTLDSRILDVGCGNGGTLARLRCFGFRKLEGVEPFIKADVDFDSVKIHRARFEDFQGGRYDLIMLHHVMEHLPETETALARIARLLAPGGCLVVRIPIVGSHAWRHYGTDWIQLDAPRHLVLYTPRGLEQLAGRCGLKLCGVIHDSDAFQFYGSEQYRRDIPLEDPRSVFHDPPLGPFTRREMDEFARRAVALNQDLDGDQACFFFKHAAGAGLTKTRPA